MVEKIKYRLGNLKGLKIAMLGLAFKPNTDDMREAASIVISNHLVEEGANIYAYDPIAIEKAKAILPSNIVYTTSLDECLEAADVTVIVTEWDEFKAMDLNKFKGLVKTPLLFDGRNCFDLDEMDKKVLNIIR